MNENEGLIPLMNSCNKDKRAILEFNQLSDEVREIVSNISPKALMYANKGLYTYLYERIRVGVEKKKIKKEIKITFGFALLHSLALNSVLIEIKNNKRYKVFNKMDLELIYCFLSCHCVSVLFNGVFQKAQLIEYKSLSHRKRTTSQYSTSINKLIGELLNIGFIEELTLHQVYSKTGLVSASNNRGTYARKNYRISLKGHAELDRFIKIYTSIHEKMTENTFLHDFLTLK
jgi:hypothetical protein